MFPDEDVRGRLTGLLDECAASMPDIVLSDAVRGAFMATPRHAFVGRYRRRGESTWNEVTPESLAQHLDHIYRNDRVIIVGDDDRSVSVTVSQPSWVLRTLQLLDLAPGLRVLEVGAGSGWHAALMGRLVAPGGTVTSLEIREELVAPASAVLRALSIENVDIVAGDGADGCGWAGPFDRGIFTAGAQDLPAAFHTQMREGALLLFALKVPGTWDRLLVLRKEEECFVSQRVEPLGMVPMVGRLYGKDVLARVITEVPEAASLPEVARRPFFWGGRGRQGSDWRTAAARDFLARVEPGFEPFRRSGTDPWWGDDLTFGVWADGRASLVLVDDDQLVSYGSLAAEQRLMRCLHDWLEVGMPGPTSYDVRIYPASARVDAGPGRWLQKGPESLIVWSLAS